MSGTYIFGQGMCAIGYKGRHVFFTKMRTLGTQRELVLPENQYASTTVTMIFPTPEEAHAVYSAMFNGNPPNLEPKA